MFDREARTLPPQMVYDMDGSYSGYTCLHLGQRRIQSGIIASKDLSNHSLTTSAGCLYPMFVFDLCKPHLAWP